MFRFLVIVALVPAMVFGLSNPQQCLSGAALPTAVRVSNCAAAPCDLVIGSTKVMELDFIATPGLQSPSARVFAESLGMTGEYELPAAEADVCSNLTNGRCPLDDGEDATYTLKMEVSEIYPITTMVLEVSINDDAGAPITCFRFPAQTVRG